MVSEKPGYGWRPKPHDAEGTAVDWVRGSRRHPEECAAD